MPRRTDLRKILIVGSGPTVIGQGSELDDAASQAARSLIADGYEVVVLQSDPATRLADPHLAHRTYIEPVTPATVEKVIERERPDAFLPTVGGQTALTAAALLSRDGVLADSGVELLGAGSQAIAVAEDRQLFKQAMQEIGVSLAASGVASSVEEGMAVGRAVGLPLVLRPSFTFGGAGSSAVYNFEELPALLSRAIAASPVGQALVERSTLGWKQFTLEVLRDAGDAFAVAATIEHLEPTNVHRGDSAAVIPAQTLSAEALAECAELARRVLRRVGCVGSADVKFAAGPDGDGLLVVGVNPRLSRSAAFAMKATGLPLAHLAARLAVGYTLDELGQDFGGPPLCAVRLPCFCFERFPGASRTLGTSMKSVGAAIGLGTSFREAYHKARRALRAACEASRPTAAGEPSHAELMTPSDARLDAVRRALKAGYDLDALHEMTLIDRAFLEAFQETAALEAELARHRGPDALAALPEELLRRAKSAGLADGDVAALTATDAAAVRERRRSAGLTPVCAAAGAARALVYPTGAGVPDLPPETRDRRRVLLVGGGPACVGHGGELDDSCRHAVGALRSEGCDVVVVNPNPYAATKPAAADDGPCGRLYLEPLTVEDLLAVVERERPDSVALQFAGPSCLHLGPALDAAGVRLLGTPADSVARAADPARMQGLVQRVGLRCPPRGRADSLAAACGMANRIGYPVLVECPAADVAQRVAVVEDECDLRGFLDAAGQPTQDAPVLIAKLLEDAIEVDVDAVADGSRCVMAGVVEHIERAGVHSADSVSVIPPRTLRPAAIDEVRRQTHLLAQELGVVGLLNVRFAVHDTAVHVLEVHPFASATLPLVTRAIGVPLAAIAARVQLGRGLDEVGFTQEAWPAHVAVKVPVFPFARFPGVDAVLGPRMRSTGQVMGIGPTFAVAFAKAMSAAGQTLPTEGTVFLSLCDRDKTPAVVDMARKLCALGLRLIATNGTRGFLGRHGIAAERISKVSQGGRPNVVDLIKDGAVALVLNTPSGKTPRRDEVAIRTIAWTRGVTTLTTVPGMVAAADAIEALRDHDLAVKSIQEYHQPTVATPSTTPSS